MSGDPELEEGSDLAPRFSDKGLIAAATTDASSGRLLMVAWMNAEALQKTIETGDAYYWSRSRGELWRKGATSGATQKVREIRIDCDQDAVELVVDQTGGACHTSRRSCFYRRIEKQPDGTVRLSFIE
ncbi:MAG: phosphoribosyl-AMP cyclohydrolase [Parvularculaceae bacterium]|nr:MAG: phosphoribosyl-AMP cyclohydrolase [Parvularculaceae bacterium]